LLRTAILAVRNLKLIKMTEEKIKKMLKDIFEATYKSDRYVIGIISEKHQIKIESIIRNHLIEIKENDFIELNSKVGMLEAKVFMYEQIISKSNFASMVCSKNNELAE
jgi:hypothetical protein